MKRWLTTFAAVLFCSAALRADVTVVQTTTIEGGMAAMAASAGQNISPKLTTRIKGTKTRNEMDAGQINVVTILDLATRQVIILRADQKTATVANPAQPPTAPAAPTTGPSIDASVKPTGKSQVIDGIKCDEYAFTTTMDMASMSGAQVPPEAAAMMQGMKMQMEGSMWVAKDAPGAAEYLAFQKSMAASDMARSAMGATGMSIPGMDKLTKAMGSVNGLTYLTEMTLTVDGTGQLADMMKQMGPMKITAKVNSVSTESLSDDLFKIPEGYTVIKQ